MDNAKKRMNEAEEMYWLVQEDNKKLEAVLSFFKDMEERRKPLEQYYTNEWLADLSRLEATDFSNDVTNEDALFNELTDQYRLVKKLLYLCASYIKEDIEDDVED